MTLTDISLRELKEERLIRLWRDNPALYARQRLEVEWWGKQLEIAQALIEHKRVLVKASHSIGKSHLAGGLVNWFYDSYRPSVTLTTAPTHLQVSDVLWKEVRVQRRGRPGLQPKAARMEDAPDHFALGFTAATGDAFQGRHEAAVLIIFDEASGIHPQYWDSAEGMMTGDRCYWLAILNPTDPACRAYEEELNGNWHVITVSALEHPNIAAELEGREAPYPKAVRLGWVEDRLKEWCDRISVEDARAEDIEFPPGSGIWYRPGPLFEGRVLGRWPSVGTYAVWSEGRWQACMVRQEAPGSQPVVIGCDVARFGDDNTEMIVRRGDCVLHHESHNGWDTVQTAGRLKELALQYAAGNEARKIEVHIDDDGVGGGVVDQRAGFNFIGISAASSAMQPADYPNRRSEMWFTVSQRAFEGRLDLSRLPKSVLDKLRVQAMAPTWKLDSEGRRVVERKEDTKKRIGRSPDGMDALNLAYAPGRRIGRIAA
jgi:hypothetical protein